MPDNDYIAEQFSMLAKLMDIHGENTFKIRSYSTAAFTIEKLPRQLSELPVDQFVSIKGIGDAIGKKISGILVTGELALLREYMEKTPPGVIEMLNLKGLGPKKIATIWKEMGIESIGELLYACQENRLLLFKGFGEKTQKNTRETIEFYLRSQGSHLYSEVETYALSMDQILRNSFSHAQFAITGEFRRQLEIIHQLDWVTTLDLPTVRHFFETRDFIFESEEPGPIAYSRFRSPEGHSAGIYCCPEESFYTTLFTTSSSPVFIEAFIAKTGWDPTASDQVRSYRSEEEIFESASLHFIPAPGREEASVIDNAKQRSLPEPVQVADIRAIIHSHSNWSDGSNTLEEMAKACIEKGLEYLVISDHSKSAFYANGLKEDRIREQHLQIAELNEALSPFRVFRSIECDILNDGQLDYSDEILSSFDLVIASIHSNLKMNEEKATARLLKAIGNPYTTILGHMTGRLLLSRPGYPLDTKKIIDTCSEHNVVIELNAHPRRLDIDWRWIRYALEKGVLISIDPDAHSTAGYNDIKYGVLAAQKAGLTKDRNLSSFNLHDFEAFLAERKRTRGL